MKRFAFGLETLLRHRTNLEEKERTILSRIQFNLESEFRQRDMLEQKTRGVLDELKRLRVAGAPQEELGWFFPYLDRLRFETDQCQQRIVRIQKELEAQKTVLVEASKKKKVLETLKKRKKAEYTEAADRQEQKDTDDLIVSRFNRKED
jgi:flagellar FliJ protein